MSEQLNTPNTDKSNKASLNGVLAEFTRSILLGLDDMLPAKIVSYDRITNRAVVQPLIKIGTTSGDKVSRGKVANIPVYMFGGGGFFMSFPIKPGDFGWIKTNDRDISLVLQSGEEDWPNTKRLHSFSDAMFFPDTLKDWIIDGSNSEAAVFQNTSGSVSLSIHEDKLVIKAPLIQHDAPTQIFNGNLTVNGTTTMNGDVNTNGGLNNNGTNVGSTHYHVGSPPDKTPV